MTTFAARIVQWQRQHGRHDLPWQQTRDPYAVWVSEIMLQQTQVAAVIGYYDVFMRRFPTIESLAAASTDEVLRHWSGLGYYARARNLQRAARIIMDEHQGRFPADFATMQTLPGIGRSTAAAIGSFAFGLAQPILDGNVKRVFARYFLIEAWPGLAHVEKTLWQLAETQMPSSDADTYAQGLMDLGATLCTRSRPRCDACPLQPDCGARRAGRVAELPVARPRRELPQKATTMLLLLWQDRILLEKRPPQGIWGGLWSLPETGETDLRAAVGARYGLQAEPLTALPPLVHGFTHFRLHITPQPLRVIGSSTVSEAANAVFMPRAAALTAALPTPVRKILQSL